MTDTNYQTFHFDHWLNLRLLIYTISTAVYCGIRSVVMDSRWGFKSRLSRRISRVICQYLLRDTEEKFNYPMSG